MWYKTALKYNYFGQLIQGNPKNQFKVRNFAEEEDLENEEDREVELHCQGFPSPLIANFLPNSQYGVRTLGI